MYIDKLFDENIGPIEKVSIEFPFKEDGTPKPVVFVGENGSGKSTLLSNIVDSLYSIAVKKFDNAMQPNNNGGGHQYYKAISSTEIKVGKEYLYSYILFTHASPIQYVFKSGNLSTTDFKSKIPSNAPMTFSWQPKDNFKQVNASDVNAEEIFNANVICYFGPDRYEKPMWMGSKYLEYENELHPSAEAKWAGVLNNPISVKNVTETNLQWLMDIIVDSRPDIEKQNDGLVITHIDVPVLLTMGTARKNLETILSQILGKEVYFSLNFRNRGGSRFKIVECGSNQVVAPTLDSLSTGQIALFNMFSTIVRYADKNNLTNSISLSEITGIVVIDEIELHLHTSLQKEVLPKLIKLFPKVQFVITSHAPLFLLGMQETFDNDGYEIYEMPTATKINVERFSEFQRAYDYFKETETYQKDAQNAITSITPAKKILVITEGATDWKHMKVAMDVLRKKEAHDALFNGLDFEFFEYEPINSTDEAVHKLQMGNSVLSSICENICKMPQEVTRIFIADRDDDKTNTKLGGKERNYKSWGNSTYSFLLPIPSSRAATPAISIEHLFSDTEIKAEILCDDGISRRLYMGNEFDEYGHAQAIDRFCERKDICGPNKINVIEGSQGDRIHSFSNTANINNYALSKMNFAKHVMAHPECFNFDNFVEIFKIIKAIIEEENGNA